jgi:DMSO reductase anchor subunit
LFLALYTGQLYALGNLLPSQQQGFYWQGSLLALVLLGLGLFASFFHLGHPERAWRAISQWRTSWLSREVIVLPAFMAAVALYGLVHWLGWTTPWFSIQGRVPVDASLLIGMVGTLLAFALYICTAMIYASLRFLEEWHSPLTPLNFTLLGLASGFTLAAAWSAWSDTRLIGFFGIWAVLFTLAGAVGRGLSLRRNRRLRHKSNLQTAIGIRHSSIVQKSQGFMGGAFNTREFFHGAGPLKIRVALWFFVLASFVAPVLLLGLAYRLESATLPLAAFMVQYLGLLFERWYFFIDAQHPQNLYYQSMA